MTDDLYLDNPAGRLQATFARAQAEPPNQAAIKVWCKVLSVSTERPWVLTERFGEMARMVSEVRERVSQLSDDDDPDLAVKHLGEVETVLGLTPQLVNNSIEWHLTPLTGLGMYGLAHCSSLLHRRCPEQTVDDSSVANLREQVSRLIEEVRATDDLDETTRHAVLDRLNDVYEALRRYELAGSRGLRKAADSLLGSLLTDRDVWKRSAQSAIAQGLFSLVVALDLALNLTANYQAITNPHEPSPVVVEVWTRATECEAPPLALPVAAGSNATAAASEQTDISESDESIE